MEAILLGAGVGLVKAIESGLAARSVSQLFGVMDNIVSHPLLDEELDKLDIVPMLQTVGALVKDVPDDLKADEAAGIALNNIVDMLDKIRLTLERLNKETEYHNTQRWLASLRSPQYDLDLAKLRTYKTILEQRIDLFIKILSLQRTGPAQGKKKAVTTPAAEAVVEVEMKAPTTEEDIDADLTIIPDSSERL